MNNSLNTLRDDGHGPGVEFAHVFRTAVDKWDEGVVNIGHNLAHSPFLGYGFIGHLSQGVDQASVVVACNMLPNITPARSALQYD